VDHGDGFTAWYGATVGMLTFNADDDYERGETLIKSGQPVCVPG
jgi:3-phenylpropionate/trans-cinnamate dioxygenase ferredoxin reductase subunit